MKNLYRFLTLFVTPGLIACSKDHHDSPDALVTVKVSDYLDNTPIEGALLTRNTTYLNLACFCFVSSGYEDLGVTNGAGMIHNLKLGTHSDVFIEKFGYLYPGTLDKNGSLWDFKLFKSSGLDITLVNNNHPQAFLEVWPILKDGKIAPYYAGSYFIGNLSNQETHAAGGLQNRILVLNRNSPGAPDTLARLQVLVPYSGVMPLTITL